MKSIDRRALNVTVFQDILLPEVIAIIHEKIQIFLGVIFKSVDGSMLVESVSRRHLTWVQTDWCLFLFSAPGRTVYLVYLNTQVITHTGYNSHWPPSQ